jgi:poly-gamma-glutamate synthesis protein (capsule biosynthesis protein)
MPPAAAAREIVLNDTVYRVSDKPGLTYEMNAHDHYAILAAIHAARESVNLVVFTIHAHESATGLDDDNPEPPDFLIQLFHEAVQAGADVVSAAVRMHCAASRYTGADPSSTAWVHFF